MLPYTNQRIYKGREKEMKQKRKPWTRFRHRVVTQILRCILGPYSRLRYGVKTQRLKEERQYLIVMNHQTPFDQFFVGITFRGPVYYVATEDIFSMGRLSSLIRWLVAPIPIKKQTMDTSAVRTCIQVAREGGSIAIAPEGNRTYSGKTEYIKPSIAKLVRGLKLPLACFRIEGGYGVQPRWSDVIRRGPMKAYVSRVVEPREYRTMSDEELFALIQQELYVNEAQKDHLYFHENAAEYLERAIYVCPDCGLSRFESHRDTIQCLRCNRKVRYLPTKELQGEGFSFPFRFVADWYDYQQAFVNQLDLRQFTQEPLYRDTVQLSQVIVYQRKNLLEKSTELQLYGDRYVITNCQGQELVLPFDEVSTAAVLGRNKLNLYSGDTIYQIKGSKRFNALKYVNFLYRYKNTGKDGEDGKFLGL